MSYLLACQPLITNANYPLRLVDYECVDRSTTTTSGDYNIKNILLRDNTLFVAKGPKGVDVYGLNPSDTPIANSLEMKKLTSYSTPANIIAQGHDVLFIANNKRLTVLRVSGGSKYVYLSLIDFEILSSDITFIKVDKYLKYAYIGLSNGLKIYDIEKLKIKYDYTNSFPNITSLDMTKDSLYMTHNDKLEIYKKTFISDNLSLNKVYEDLNASNIKILEINKNKIFFINKLKNSMGYYNIAPEYENDTSLAFQMDGNDNILANAKQNITLNHFYTDGVYKVISSKSGLIILDENNQSFHDLTFNSGKTLVYKNFLISSDNTATSSAIRVYKFSDIYISRTSGQMPLIVDFKIRSLNLKNVSWDFKDGTLPSYNQYPSHVFNFDGTYDVESTITYNNGDVQKEIIPIEVYPIQKLKLDIASNIKLGNVPLKIRVDLNSSSLLKDISWSISDIDENNSSNISTVVTNIRTSPLHYTFTKKGDYIVTVKAEDIDGNKAEQNLSIKVHSFFKPSIQTSLLDNFVFKDVNFSVIVKDENGNIKIDNSIIEVEDIIKDIVKDKNDSMENNNTEDNNNTAEDANVSTDNNSSTKDKIKDEDKDEDEDKKIGPNINSDRNITHYKWTFHNNAVSNQKNVVFNYKKPGEYNISLEITDTHGLTYKSHTTITIHPNSLAIISLPDKNIHESPYEADMSLILEDDNKYIIDSLWVLPNGRKSVLSSLSYSFKNEGTYRIKNFYTLSNGVKGVATTKVIINDEVDINFSSSVNYGFSPLKVDFKVTGIAPSGIKYYEVNFGEGNISKIDTNNTSFSHTYKQHGIYNIEVSAHSNKGHIEKYNKTIYAINADLSYSILTKDLDKLWQNRELAVAFDAKISDKTFIKSTRWFYGDGDMKADIDEIKVNYTYKSKRVYNAKFEITLLNGAILSKNIEVKYPEFEGNVNLYSGWNLISNPLSLSLKKSCTSGLQVPTCVSTSILGKYIDLWMFKDNKWENKPESIETKYGFWIKVKNNTKLAFYGSKNTLNTDNLSVGNWHLLGSGTDINGTQLKSFLKTYIFNPKSQVYIENPSNIPSAQGFYGIK